MVLDQRTSGGEDLAAAIASLATDSGKQLAMSQAMRELERPRAAQAIVDRLQTLASPRRA